jgi:hypothetical protein
MPVDAAMKSQTKLVFPAGTAGSPPQVGRISGDYNENDECNDASTHKGYDFNRGSEDDDLGDPVYAIYPGFVVDATLSSVGYGNRVYVRHQTRFPVGQADRSTSNYESLYAHLNAIAPGLSEGDSVLRGQLVGFIGKTGNAGNPKRAHLHFELRRRLNDTSFPDPLMEETTQDDSLNLDAYIGCINGNPRSPITARSGINGYNPGDLWVALQWCTNNNNDGDCSDPAESSFKFGRTSDIPLAGDWDNNGTDTPGIFRPPNIWCLSNNFDGDCADPGERNFAFGSNGDKPVVGDWFGSSSDLPAVVRGNVWYLNYGYDAVAEFTFAFGSATDIPIMGNWEGCSVDTPGVIRNVSGGLTWYLNDSFDGIAERVYTFGSDPNASLEEYTDDVPLEGDWDGLGCVQPIPPGNGDTLGVMRDIFSGPVQGAYWLLDNNFDAVTDQSFPFGLHSIPLDTPIAGDWDGNNPNDTDSSGILRGVD